MKYCRPLTGQRIVTGFVTYTTEQSDSSHHLKSDAGFLQLFSNNMFVLPSAFSETKFCLPAVTNRHPFDISYVCAWYSLQWKPEIQKRYPVPKVIRAAPYETEDEAGSIQHFSFCQIKIFCSDLVNPPSSTSTCRSTSVQKFSCVCLSVTESHKRPPTDPTNRNCSRCWSLKGLSLQPESCTVLQTLLKRTSISHTVTVGRHPIKVCPTYSPPDAINAQSST